jgi:gag-polypeptide of LTR copia-type
LHENQEKSNKSLVNFLLNGDNYLTWARAIKLALGGQSKLEHIFGKIETIGQTPTTEEEKTMKKGKDVE